MKFLLISHEATKTGAPIVLLQVAKALSTSPGVEFDIIFLKNGELVDDFRPLARKCYVPLKGRSLIYKAQKYFLGTNKEHYYIDWFIKQNRSPHYDWIYANTVASLDAAVRIKNKLNIPIIAHIHELEYALNALIGLEHFIEIVKAIDRFIAVSYATQNILVNLCGVPEQKIRVLYPSSGTVAVDRAHADRIRKELGIGSDTFVIGGAGNLSWTKGIDAFLLIAKECLQRMPEGGLIFLWVGGVNDPLYLQQIKIDLKKLNLGNGVKFVGPQKDRFDYFSLFSAFLFCSKEESFGLVALENAFLGKPIVCFENCGGFNEFLTAECGITIPYLDIRAGADALLKLRNNPELAREYGERAKDKALQLFGAETFKQNFQDLIIKDTSKNQRRN